MDHDFLLLDELRPVRLQLELLKPELILKKHEIESTIVIFGSTRIPEPKAAYDQLAEVKAAATKEDGAAAILGLHPSTLRAGMQKLGIVRPETKEPN